MKDKAFDDEEMVQAYEAVKSAKTKVAETAKALSVEQGKYDQVKREAEEAKVELEKAYATFRKNVKNIPV